MSKTKIDFQEYFGNLAPMDQTGAMAISKEITDWLNEENLKCEAFLNTSATSLGEGLWRLPSSGDVVSSKMIQLENDFYTKKLTLKNEYFNYINSFKRNDNELSSQLLKSHWKTLEDKLQFGFMLLSNTAFKSTSSRF